MTTFSKTQQSPSLALQSDIPDSFSAPIGIDYVREEHLITMRDGVEIFTVVMKPKGIEDAPLVLESSPYSASKLTSLSNNVLYSNAQLYAFHAELLQAGYILAVMDVRGKYNSGGRYEMNLPLKGEFNPGQADYATDIWDTIEWLIHNIDECNGRVGTLGISYDGYTALMSLVGSHPALKACVPMNPMVDGWMGDDWFRKGAFRQALALPYTYAQTATKDSSLGCPMPHYDEYETWLEAGSANNRAKQVGVENLPAWKRLVDHQAYDEYWQSVAVDKILADLDITVPTLNVHSQWDAEDIYGAMAVYEALEQKAQNRPYNYLVIGPWSHAGVGFDKGYKLGDISFGSETAAEFRRNILHPFLDELLKEGKEKPTLSKVSSFETGSNRWQQFDCWPPKAQKEPSDSAIFLQEKGQLSFSKPVLDDHFEAYVSDPAKPVTYQQRPIRRKGAADSTWDAWLVDDQRFASTRPDVLTFCGPVLTKPLKLSGQPIANLFASITGTDCDWVVKLIDVYPHHVPDDPKLSGYQLPISMDVLRARYRESYTTPAPVTPNEVFKYQLDMPHVSHCFMPGHRIMVQIQSSWFPLYDRNPQSFVDNIALATAEDFIKSQQQVYCDRQFSSCIELPIID